MMEIMLEIMFVRRNLFRINCEWKYFLENLFVKLKHEHEKEATVDAIVKNCE